MSRKPTWLIHSRHCAAVYSKPPAVSISMLRLSHTQYPTTVLTMAVSDTFLSFVVGIDGECH